MLDYGRCLKRLGCYGLLMIRFRRHYVWRVYTLKYQRTGKTSVVYDVIELCLHVVQLCIKIFGNLLESQEFDIVGLLIYESCLTIEVTTLCLVMDGKS